MHRCLEPVESHPENRLRKSIDFSTIKFVATEHELQYLCFVLLNVRLQISCLEQLTSQSEFCPFERKYSTSVSLLLILNYTVTCVGGPRTPVPAFLVCSDEDSKAEV
jgi:hypothetical protein